MSEENVQEQAAPEENALLESIREAHARGEKIRTKFDDFWDQGVGQLEHNIRNSMKVTDDDQVKQLLALSKGIARMTWASQLSIMSASFEQMAQMEMAVSQVISEVTKKEAQLDADLEATDVDDGHSETVDDE